MEASKQIKLGIFDQKDSSGRPPILLEDIIEDWEEIMIEVATEGGSDTALRVALGLTMREFETLLRNHEEFRRVYSRCHDLSMLWWEQTGSRMVTGARGSAPVYCFTMANRFGWRAKTEFSGDPTSPIGIETSNKKLSKEELIEQLRERGLPTSIFGESLDGEDSGEDA